MSAVYLLHENIGVRYGWQKWFGAEEIGSVPELFVRTIIAVLIVFITGVVVEWIRIGFVKAMGILLSHLKIWQKMIEKLTQIDHLFVAK